MRRQEAMRDHLACRCRCRWMYLGFAARYHAAMTVAPPPKYNSVIQHISTKREFPHAQAHTSGIGFLLTIVLNTRQPVAKDSQRDLSCLGAYTYFNCDPCHTPFMDTNNHDLTFSHCLYRAPHLCISLKRSS